MQFIHVSALVLYIALGLLGCSRDRPPQADPAPSPQASGENVGSGDGATAAERASETAGSEVESLAGGWAGSTVSEKHGTVIVKIQVDASGMMYATVSAGGVKRAEQGELLSWDGEQLRVRYQDEVHALDARWQDDALVVELPMVGPVRLERL